MLGSATALIACVGISTGYSETSKSAPAIADRRVEPTQFSHVTRTVLAPQATTVGATSGSAASSGLRVYLDANGKPTTPPPGAAITGPAANTSSQGLKEVKSAVPGGGYILDLNGRFITSSKGTIGPDGKVNVECTTNPLPAPGSEQVLPTTTTTSPAGTKE